jgi:16S rRNA (guanine1207-N2)-methyltransferase
MNNKSKNSDHYFTEHPRSRPRFGMVRTCFRGRRFEFLTASGVFSTKRLDLGTRLLIESMVLPKQGSVLDIGCGYGAVGIAAGAFNPGICVLLTDVNARAVWLARQNIQRNHIDNAHVRRGWLYEPVKDFMFDCVLSNPPVSAGMKTVKAIVSKAPKHMVSEANFQMVIRSKIAGKRFRGFFEEAFGNVEVLARQSGYRVLMSEKY